jgi:CBS domain-containing protein
MQQYRLIDIFTSEGTRWNGKPIGEALVQTVVSLKIAARCHVMRGVGGCYENGELSTQRLEVLSYNMPLHIEIVVPVTALDVLLPKVEEMVTDGIVALRNLEVISYKTRKVLIHRHIRVRQIMTPSPQKAFLNTPVSQVVEWLLSSIFTGVPVVDTENRPVGIITQSDLIYRAGMPVRLGLLAKSDDVKLKTVLHDLSDKMAKDIMTTPAVSIAEDRMITDAVDLMLQNNIKRLSVVDARGKLVGMASRLDIFRSIMKESPDWNTFGKQDIHVENLHFVSDIMRRDSHTVSPDTSVEDVIQMIGANDIQRIAVVDASGRFLGLIFDSEILAFFSTEDPDGIWDYLSSRMPFTEKGRRYQNLKQMLRARTAADIMNSDVVTVQEDAVIDDAILIMVEKGFKRLPVLDNHLIFKGMISRDSLLRTGFAAGNGK